MNVQLRLGTLCIFTLLTGCSSSPTEGDAQRILEQQISEQSAGIIKLLSANLYNLERFKKGARKRLTSALMLEKSENGWRLSHM